MRREAYLIRCLGSNAVWGDLGRKGKSDGRIEDMIHEPYGRFNVEQTAAWTQAYLLVARNAPGDRNAAIAELQRGFQNAFLVSQ
ncbi:MAG TPA: hypothetical protein VIG30_00950 [Ktedonobacterales bacterium]